MKGWKEECDRCVSEPACPFKKYYGHCPSWFRNIKKEKEDA